MTIAVYFGTVLLNFIYYAIHKRFNRENRFILLLTLVALGIIFVYGIDNADMIYYKPYYDTVSTRAFKATEIGFYLIVLLANKLSLGYIGLRLITFLWGQLFLMLGLNKLCLNKHLFIVLYCLFSFYIDDIQLRNFVASCIVFFAFSFLQDENDMSGCFKYILFVLLATTFHTSAIFYLSFIWVKLPYRKIWLQLLAILVFLLEIVIVINGKRVPFISTIANIILANDTRRALQYFSSTTNGSVSVVILILLNIMLAYYTYRYTEKINGSGQSIVSSRNIFYCSIIQLIWLPLLWINVEFYRFPRNMLLLHYATLCNFLVQEKRKPTKKKLVIIFMYIVNLIAWLYIAYYRISDWNTIFEPIFYQNGLLN